jgi:hypothetical protein
MIRILPAFLNHPSSVVDLDWREEMPLQQCLLPLETDSDAMLVDSHVKVMALNKKT